MPKNIDYNFYCPECGKKAATANPMFIRYSIIRLELPIFLCSNCRTIGIDKPVVRRIISRWRKASRFFTAGKMSFNKLCKEFIEELEQALKEHWIPLLGYKKARFLKRPTPNP